MKQRLLKSKNIRVALNCFRNWQNRKELPLGSRLPHGEHLSPVEALAYADRVVEDFVRYGELSKEELQGAYILELGPGANQLVGRSFLNLGVTSFLSIDRYDCLAPDEIRHAQEQAWEEREEEKKPLDGLSYNPGQILETMDDALGEQVFDLILSRAVLEYVKDIDALFSAMAKVLKAGGRMVHKIDFRDDGLFSNAGLHPLTRFTLPRVTYHAMTSHSYRPTENLWGDFQAVAVKHGFEAKGWVTHLTGGRSEIMPHQTLENVGKVQRQAAFDSVAAIRSKLHADYSSLKKEDFMISGIFMIADKKAEA